VPVSKRGRRGTAVLIVCAVSWVGFAAPAAVGTSASRIAVIGDSYTAGSDEGGNGRRAWPELVRGLLALEGVDIDADIAAEGGAGHGQRGDGGSAHPTDAGPAYMAAKIAPLIFAQLTIRV
jgi:hypothetical protein